MIQQVRRLARQAGDVFRGGGDHRFHGFLAHLPRDPGEPGIEQLRRVRPGGPVARPLGDGAGEPGERAARGLAEAGRRPGVARGSVLAHHVEDRVAVAVHAHLPDFLRVARRFPFAPHAAARAAVIVRLPGGAGLLERLAVGETDHQDLAQDGALSDDGDESIVPEAHGLNPILGGHARKIPAVSRIVKIALRRISSGGRVTSRRPLRGAAGSPSLLPSAPMWGRSMRRPYSRDADRRDDRDTRKRRGRSASASARPSCGPGNSRRELMGRKPLWLAGLALVLVGCDDTFVPVLPPCTSSGTPLTLAVAQYRSLDPFLGSGCTLFPASGAGSVEYLLVPQSASSTPNDSQGFKLQGAAAALAALAPQLVVPEAPPAELSPAERFHLFLRQAERTRAYGTPPPQAAPSALAAPQVPATITPVDSGSQRTFKVCGNLQCTTPLPTVTATAKKVGQHIAIYVDNAAPANGLSQADLDALRDVFDNQLYAVDRGAFGAESDIDSNAVVIVLMTNKVNQLVPKADCQPKGFVAGYFFGADIDPVFRTSYNNAEIFYSIVADTGALSCAHTVSAVKNIVPVTFVHEFQHMISYNQHVLLRGGAAEVLWLNEAMSHYAEERGGRSF